MVLASSIEVNLVIIESWLALTVECRVLEHGLGIIAKRKSFVMHERASGLESVTLVDEDCVGRGSNRSRGTLAFRLTFRLGVLPFSFLALRRLILFRLPLSVMTFFFFAMPRRLIPLSILGFRLDWARALRGDMLSRATDCASARLSPRVIPWTIMAL